MNAWLLAVMLEAVVTAHDAAPPSCRVSLTTESTELHGLDLDALRTSVRAETGCDVLDAPSPEVPQIVLRVDDATHAHLSLTHVDARRLERDVVLDPDLVERVHALAIVATHMLRNEAEELLASLSQRDEVAVVVTEPTPDAAPVEEPAPAATVAPPRPPSAPIVRIALGGLMSSVPSGSGFEATFVGGLEVGAIVTPWLVIGARDLSGSGLLRPRGTWAVGGAPFVELAWRFDDTWSIHGQIGVDLRAIGAEAGLGAGVAPFVIAGGRVQVVRELSIAVQTGLHVVATDASTSALHLLPQAAILWSGGLSIAVHL